MDIEYRTEEQKGIDVDLVDMRFKSLIEFAVSIDNWKWTIDNWGGDETKSMLNFVGWMMRRWNIVNYLLNYILVKHYVVE